MLVVTLKKYNGAILLERVGFLTLLPGYANRREDVYAFRAFYT